MLEHVWCSIKHLIQHHPTFLLFSCWMHEILFVWPVSTTWYMRARALGLQIQCSLKMSASEEAAQNIDQTSSKRNTKTKSKTSERGGNWPLDRPIGRQERTSIILRSKRNMSVSDIRNKIVGLRSQLARELAKTNSKKPGQGRYECYESTWIYWERLQFLKRCRMHVWYRLTTS